MQSNSPVMVVIHNDREYVDGYALALSYRMSIERLLSVFKDGNF